MRRVTGQYKVSTVSGESVQAFIPAPLPPDPPLAMTSQRQRKLEQALLACGRLDGVGALLPDPELFLYPYVRREAVLSSQIEGTQSSLSDLLLFEIDETPGVPFDDVVEVSNYVAALDHGLSRLREDFPLSNRLIREIHAILLQHGRGATKQPGVFRRSQNWIGGTRPGNARFVPPPPQQADQCMASLEQYLHGPEPALIKAALAHVQFETIHPFLDGNGRTGRLLIALILHHEDVLHQPLLYLSHYFKEHRDEYYHLLDSVRTQGDWEAWVDFFLEGVAHTGNAAVATAHRLLDMFADDRRRIQQASSAASVLHAFDQLQHRPILTAKRLAEQVGLSPPTAIKALDELDRLGIVREITGRRRSRIYAYERYTAILSEGVEPQ